MLLIIIDLIIVVTQAYISFYPRVYFVVFSSLLHHQRNTDIEHDSQSTNFQEKRGCTAESSEALQECFYLQHLVFCKKFSIRIYVRFLI